MNKLIQEISQLDLFSSPKKFVPQLLQIICFHLGFSAGSVMEILENGKGTMFAIYNLPENYMNGVNAAGLVFTSPSGEALKTGKIIVSKNPLQDHRLKPWWHLLKQSGICSLVWVPLFTQGKAFGTCCFYHFGHEDSIEKNLTQEEYLILEQLGLFISICIAANRHLNALSAKTMELEKEIEKRKMAEQIKQEKKELLDGILAGIQDGIYILDKEYTVQKISNAATTYWGVTEPVVGKKCYEIFRGKRSSCFCCPVSKTLQMGRANREIITFQKGQQKNMHKMEVIAVPFAVTRGKVERVLVLIRDVTETIRLEQEMYRLENLHLVGKMAAGMSHEIRNPMTTVRGLLQVLNDKRDCEHYKQYFSVMIEELDRANGMIEEFLSLARDKVSQQKLQNLNDIIYSLYPLMAADAYHSKKQIKLLLEDIPKLLLDEKEIRQLLLNLVRNGLEAMESGGIVYIETRMDNGEVILSVSDQGTGIRQDILSKVGIPFFSTKSGGTGMGLAVCYGIAARHNAVIKINTSAKGSIFSVCFKRPNRD